MTAERSPAVRLVPFDVSHVPVAAELVATGYRRLLESVPLLPAAWADRDAIARLLSELAARGSGITALRGDTPIGFQAASMIDGHGGRWAYTPDVGHASPDRRVAESLYAALADGWVRDACLEHVVTVFADDTEMVRTFADLGFGVTVVDLVRGLDPLTDPPPVGAVTVRRAGPDDAAAVMGLDDGLRRHLTASPIFLRLGPPRAIDLHRRTLADPAIATLLAEQDGRALAFLRVGPSATDVATIVRDPGTASITGAFTLAGRRGEGMATALLQAALAWALDGGFVRCAVDHESANLEAARFWRRHFVPVALSLTRRLAPLVAG